MDDLYEDEAGTVWPLQVCEHNQDHGHYTDWDAEWCRGPDGREIPNTMADDGPPPSDRNPHAYGDVGGARDGW